MEADPVVTLLAITSTAFVTSTLTALIGAGGGTALLLVMLWFVPAASVVPVHGCIQLVSNTARVVLFRRHMHWPVIIRFVIPMPAGVYVGLQLYGMLDQSALQLVIAGFVLLSLLVRVPGAVAGRAFRQLLRVSRPGRLTSQMMWSPELSSCRPSRAALSSAGEIPRTRRSEPVGSSRSPNRN